MDNMKKCVDLAKLASRCGDRRVKILLETALKNDMEITKLKKNPCLADMCGYDHLENTFGSGFCGIVLLFIWIIFAGLSSGWWYFFVLILSIILFVYAFGAKRRDQLKIHREVYVAKMAELVSRCLQRHLAAQVKTQRDRLLGERGVFKQLGELFDVQLKAYGEPEVERPEQEVLSARPYLVPYIDPNAPAEPVRLPPELASLRMRYVEYFDAKERELSVLCDDYLPRIAELQDKARSVDSSEAVRGAASKCALYLEQEFYVKVYDILDMDAMVKKCEGMLGRLFTGSERNRFGFDLSESSIRAKQLADELPWVGATLLLPAGQPVSCDSCENSAMETEAIVTSVRNRVNGA